MSRRVFRAEQKVQILREHLVNNVKISKLAEKYDLYPSQIYKWKKKLFEESVDIFKSNRGPDKDPLKKVKKIKEKIKEKDQIIAELVEDNMKLKKKGPGVKYTTFG